MFGWPQITSGTWKRSAICMGNEKIPVWQCQQKSPFRRRLSTISFLTTFQLARNFRKSTPRVRMVRSVFASTVGRMNP